MVMASASVQGTYIVPVVGESESTLPAPVNEPQSVGAADTGGAIAKAIMIAITKAELRAAARADAGGGN
jgi:hypothetical protein